MRVTCTACSCRFAFVGAAFFCPACGENSAEHTFEQSVARVRSNLSLIETLVPTLDRDAGANLRTELTEGGIKSLVTALQRFAEAMYPGLPNVHATPRRNVFQKLVEGSALWHAGGGRPYSAVLDAGEMSDLERLFQQRHVLEHREGIVDQDYIDRSGDRTYAVGQRLVVHAEDVAWMADLVQKLGSALRADVASTPTPPNDGDVEPS
jgi:hypothetical protein